MKYQVSTTLVSLLALGTAILTGLIFYSGSHFTAWLRPDGDLVANSIAELFFMIIEISLIVGLLTYLNDRQWRPAREAIRSSVRKEYRLILKHITKLARWERSGINVITIEDELEEFKRKLPGAELENTIQCLSNAMTPTMARETAEYFEYRNSVLQSISQLDRHRLSHLFDFQTSEYRERFRPRDAQVAVKEVGHLLEFTYAHESIPLLKGVLDGLERNPDSVSYEEYVPRNRWMSVIQDFLSRNHRRLHDLDEKWRDDDW